MIGALSAGAGECGSLREVLGKAQERGFVGAGAVDAHIRHAWTFATAVEAPQVAVDLGSGGGLPALVLVLAWPASAWTLVEVMQRRAAFLRWAGEALGVSDRVTILPERAEAVGQQAAVRGAADLVTARSFGAPAVVAEVGAPLLRIGGRLAVSEPPGLSSTWERWPPAGLGRVGLVGERVVRAAANVRVLRRQGACPDGFPRSAKHQQRSPLWTARPSD